MSGKFSSTSGSFSTITLKQEEYIRQIAANECLLVLQEIKEQIEAKVKSIDRNITDLRNEVRRLHDSHKIAQINEIFDRMEKIQVEIKVLRYHHQNTLKVSRTKSLQKQRKPIFKREDQFDFSSVILGLETASEVKSQKRIFDKKQSNGKPPLPVTHTPKAKLQNKPSVDQTKQQQRSIVKRHPILEDSVTIHKWLHQNNNRQSSCFSSIIRQEDIEQSVFY